MNRYIIVLQSRNILPEYTVGIRQIIQLFLRIRLKVPKLLIILVIEIIKVSAVIIIQYPVIIFEFMSLLIPVVR